MITLSTRYRRVIEDRWNELGQEHEYGLDELEESFAIIEGGMPEEN
jgi:hypothetical protein